MITGVITPFREAIIRLVVRGSQGEEQEHDAVVDTGFTDFLTLSHAYVTFLGLSSSGTTDVTLADDSTATLNVYRASILWDGQVRNVTVLEAEGGPLIGMSLLYGHRVTLEVIDGGSVTIEALE